MSYETSADTPLLDPAISPDGKYIAYTKEVNGKAGLYIYDIKNAKERLLIGR